MANEMAADMGTVGSKKDVLVKDIKTVVGDADVLLRGVAGAAADSYSATCGKVEDKLGELRRGIDDTRNGIVTRARGLADGGRAYARENPWQVVGAVAAVGLVIGWLLRRR